MILYSHCLMADYCCHLQFLILQVAEVVVVVAVKVSFLVVDDHLHPRTLRIYNALVVVSTFLCL